jgi:hypothetical protein
MEKRKEAVYRAKLAMYWAKTAMYATTAIVKVLKFIFDLF